MKDNLRIMDIPESERPKEKLLTYGAETLNNSELLAIILRTGTRSENVIDLSKRLLKELDGLDGILDANISDITNIKGIKAGKASTDFSFGRIVQNDLKQYVPGERM